MKKITQVIILILEDLLITMNTQMKKEKYLELTKNYLMK